MYRDIRAGAATGGHSYRSLKGKRHFAYGRLSRLKEHAEDQGTNYSNDSLKHHEYIEFAILNIELALCGIPNIRKSDSILGVSQIFT
jgi:hypothetical protein